MEKVKVSIENCYGIDKLENEFDFSGGKSTQVIYAPNGIMKTSFARVFDDYSKELQSKDLIYPEHTPKRSIENEHGNSIDPESIFVIKPYEKNFKSSRISTLLVQEELREQYEEIHEKIDVEVENLLKVLKGLSGINRGIEEAFCDAFGEKKKNNLVKVLKKIEDMILRENPFDYNHITYNKVINDKVVSFLETADFKIKIKEYIEKYDELLSKSEIFKKDFNHYHAAAIQKNLTENGFFEAFHTINLNIKGKKQEVTNQEDLLKIIEDAKKQILQDETLQTLFEEIDKKISNAQLREFREYLFEHQEILPELVDIENFKTKLWISYINANYEIYECVLKQYKEGQSRIEKILEQARNEETDWENVITIFNSRFFVPYLLEIKNKEDSILKDEAPTVQYYFKNEEAKVEEDLLLRVLSQGERRTLYLLNIIFEIESRRKQGINTLFIVDDIADSFDYKNKYAIIEYLKDLSKEDGFSSIILTHNFDFFRTVQERISGNGKYTCSYMAIKEDDRIFLDKLPYNYISNPLKNWKQNLDNPAKLIASITFARNLADYVGDTESFNKLTSILHLKEETKNLTLKDLYEIYNSIFVDIDTSFMKEDERTLYDLVYTVAEEIMMSGSQEANLENKVVLSIAIRLVAEQYMIQEIDDEIFYSRLKKNQTGKLFGEFKKRFSDNKNAICILEKVNIMTPENIHLNSFMFEPLLDLSDFHLKNLYEEVLSLFKEEQQSRTLSEVASSVSHE
jgi:ABC-type lipoprotein export system ATPase subunit